MISLFGIKIHVLFILPCFMLWLFCGPIIAVGYLTAIFFHELSHVRMARLLGLEHAIVHLNYYGCKGEIEGLDCCDIGTELPIAVAGPLFNLVLALILALLSQVLYFWYYPLMGFAVANLFLGCFNMLPALPMDGGRVLRSILCTFLSREKGTRVCVNISMSIGAAFIAAFAYFAYFGSYKAPLLVIGCFTIISARGELNNVCKYRYGAMDGRNKLKSRPKRVRRVAVSCEDDLKTALAMFKNDCFNIVDVVSEDGTIQKTITETQLARQLTK